MGVVILCGILYEEPRYGRLHRGWQTLWHVVKSQRLCGMFCRHWQSKNTVHQVTTMRTTSKNVLFPGHNHPANHQYWWPDTLIITRALCEPEEYQIACANWCRYQSFSSQLALENIFSKSLNVLSVNFNPSMSWLQTHGVTTAYKLIWDKEDDKGW